MYKYLKQKTKEHKQNRRAPKKLKLKKKKANEQYGLNKPMHDNKLLCTL